MEKDALFEAVKDEKFKFRLTFRNLNPRYLNTAILHSAYLALFREYGYEYIFHADTQWIRDILMADKPPPKRSYVVLPVNAEMISADRVFGTGVALMDGVQCLVAILPAADPNLVARCVLLPGIGEQAKADYQQLREKPAGKVTITFRLLYGRAAERLKMKDAEGMLCEHWYEVAHSKGDGRKGS
jgi:hypothetical protein